MSYDYLTLIGAKGDGGSIRQWINHDRIPSAIILTFAEQAIYQTLRVRQMLKTQTGTLAVDDDTIALDASYRQRYLFMFTGTKKSRPSSELLDTVLNAFSYDTAGVRTNGKPNMYATDESNIQFEVRALEAYPWLFKYYGTLTALSESNATNFLTDRYPKLLTAACMMNAYEWTKNEREKQYWMRAFEQQVFLANREADQELAGIEINVISEGGPVDVGQALV